MAETSTAGTSGSGTRQYERDQRIESTPGFDMLRNAWETAQLGGKVLRAMFRRPFNWLPDVIYESDLNFRRCLIPLGVSQAIWLIGFGVLNFGEVAALLGVSDRDPGGVYVGFLREVSTWITMMIIAGAAGSALAADLGARKIREELDALSVLGVDMVRKLVVPRVLAMIIACVILGLLGLLISILTNYALYPNQEEFAPGVYRESTYLNINALDLYASIIKHAIIGAMIGLVACQKGLSTKGGAEGVGRTVNQTVIVTFVGIWAINSLYNIAVLTLFPELSVQKG
ncbi:MAG: phospholipid/cholesterol/gamma-HCH transport system permease protein [Solirubrobacteraceae bacterium]|nr:phospholipid/cholesterol/gamma-HCH transport system permease protein [Solirubrobacteraceae bacterium]